jgi:hypothetical protein
LETTLLPASKGSYALGADTLSKKLLYEEMVDTPVDRLLAIGEANLERDYHAFVEVARRIDPSKSPAELVESLSAHCKSTSCVTTTAEPGARRLACRRFTTSS